MKKITIKVKDETYEIYKEFNDVGINIDELLDMTIRELDINNKYNDGFSIKDVNKIVDFITSQNTAQKNKKNNGRNSD